jgi:hypothetical protein
VPLPVPSTDRAAAARDAHQRKAAERAVDDARQLARAARIVRAALERRQLELEDVIPQGSGDAAR